MIFIAGVQLYSTKIPFGGRVGADWGQPPDPPLELPLVGGELRLFC